MLRGAARRTLKACGMTVSRAGFENRFDATAVVLAQLADRGYAPRIVIDVGANVGQWTDIASRIFTDAVFHLIEPQTRCHEALARFVPPRFTTHRVAVTGPGVTDVQMIGGGRNRDGTGAFITNALPDASDATTYPATTLDSLLASRVRREDRLLMKLDIEGHELQALRGAPVVLGLTEVVFSEVRFFDVNAGGAPVFADVATLLREHGFEVYEIAALSGRRRDGRLRLGDVVFIRRGSPLFVDVGT
jgi:FkbM family methyltransferase